MRREHEHGLELFGSEVQILVGQPVRPGLPPPALAMLQVEAFLRAFHRRLTRFDDTSDLCIMNASTSAICSTSPLLTLAVRAGLWAAELSGGLVDPTLVGELERAGYSRSLAGVEPASLTEALAAAPPRRAASPHPDARWRRMKVNQKSWTVRRPPGLRFDTGGIGKGLAADIVSNRLAGYATHAIDCGGDVRLGGDEAAVRWVEIEHPLADEPAHSFKLECGAVATSGISTRLWRTEDGFAHHLLDPSTGEPAWTGVIQATAVAASALEAETLSKIALLSGPERGREVLERTGGVLIHDDGQVVVAGHPGESGSSAPAPEPLAA